MGISTRSTRLLVAIAASVALVLAAPYVGAIRSQIRAAFPAQFSFIVNGAVAMAVLAAIGWALARMRERRLARYGAIALAVAAAALYSGATASPDPAVRAVERFHFVEYGLITLLFYRVWRERRDCSAIVVPVLAAFVVGTVEEALQWFIPARVGELRDVWLNGAAIACGLAFSLGLDPPTPFVYGWRQDSLRLTGRALALSVVGLTAFVHLVHLGYEIRDPQASVFTSRYTAEELTALGRDRTERWSLHPPTERPARLSREDQYMTEGLQHVQARNTAWAAGDAFTAWRENLILERHFQPVLDTPSYASATGHRWAAAHRADAESRVVDTGTRPFVSAAYPYPIYTWSRWWLWASALLAAAALWRLPWTRGVGDVFRRE